MLGDKQLFSQDLEEHADLNSTFMYLGTWVFKNGKWVFKNCLLGCYLNIYLIALIVSL